MVTSIHGYIVKSIDTMRLANDNIDVSDFMKFRNSYGIEQAENFETFSRRSLVMMTFTHGEHSDQLFNELQSSCDLVAVGRAFSQEGAVVFTAVARRTASRIVIDTAHYGITTCVAPKLNGLRESKSNAIFKFIEAWAKAQRNIIANFIIHVETNYNADTVMYEWKQCNHYHILDDISECKRTPKRLRSERHTYIAENSTLLERMWKAMNEEPPQKKYISISDPSVPSIQILTPPPSAQVFKYVDLMDNMVKEFSGRDWLRSWHHNKTLVFYGGAGCAKTPTAMAYASCVAQLYQRTDGSEPRFYKVSQVENLPRDDLLKGTPIVFDEFRPNLPRGHNPRHTIDELKIIFDAEVGNTITGKGSNSRTTGAIDFSAGMPRIVTTNAQDTHDFIDAIPSNVLTMSPNEIAHLSDDARALLKRLAFMHVQTPLLPQEEIARFHGTAHHETTERFDAIFSGANAIP